MEIYQQFKKREVAARTKYKGDMDIAQDLKLGVQIYSRTKEEPFPTFKKYSKTGTQDNSLETGKVLIQRDYTEMDDTEQKIIPIDQ